MPSLEARVSPDGNFTVFRTESNLGFGANMEHQIYLVTRAEETGALTITHVSVSAVGGLAPLDCLHPSVSDDGKVVAFDTRAPLSASDSNGTWDVYVRDFRGASPVTRRVSRGTSEPNGASQWPFVSGDGQKVAFTSLASNLGPTDTNGVSDVYRVNSDGSGGMILVSVDNNMPPQQSTSAMGTLVVGSVTRVISGDGNLILFFGTPCNWDQLCGQIFNCLCPARFNSCSGGDCEATASRQVYLRNLTQSATFRVSRTHKSGFGLADPGDNHSRYASLSADGTRIAFASLAMNFTGGADETDTNEDIFMIDVATIDFQGVIPLKVTLGANGNSFDPMLSPSGDEVIFTSTASNLVPGDSNGLADIFVVDIGAGFVGNIHRYSVSSAGAEANGFSTRPDIGSEGKIVVYQSAATNLMAGDGNATTDVFETLSSGTFKRGDANGDGNFVAPADSNFVNLWLFEGGPSPPCIKAADGNDDGRVDVTDLSVIGGCGVGCSLPAPGQTTCGVEGPTSGDPLTCALHPCF